MLHTKICDTQFKTNPPKKLISNILNRQKQPPEVFCKKVVLKIFADFTGKQLYWNLFLIMLQAWRPANLLWRDSNTGFPCEICEIFKRTCFEEHLRTTASESCQRHNASQSMNVEITSNACFRSNLSEVFWKIASLIKNGDGKKIEVETYFSEVAGFRSFLVLKKTPTEYFLVNFPMCQSDFFL